MINFCKKSFHTLFSTAFTTLSPPQEDSFANHHRIAPLPVTNRGAGLSILATSSEIPKPAENVIGSSSLTDIPAKSDQMKTGLKVLSSCDIDKLASCTESLGFESCNERSVNNVFEKSEKSVADGKSRKFSKKNKEVKNKSFPPPLSSFNANGKPTFFLCPVRNNGRLKLTKVKIDRPESFHAFRQDGRLRLHLKEPDHKKDDVITSTDVVGEKLSDDNDKKVLEGWKFPTSSGGGEDYRSLYEQHNMHGLGQQCVSMG